MTLLFDRHSSIASPTLAPTTFDRHPRQDGRTEITIGLVNNMPDSALKATELQFAHLLRAAAAPHLHVHFHCFSLPSIVRSPSVRTHVADRYRDIAELGSRAIDGLIVTGAEPIADSLRDEPYWPELAALVDWAKTNTRSAIWSCLAAHAAVLHLDGIERRRLPAKCSGIYDCAKITDDWLTRDLLSPLKVSHSRVNAVNENELVARGYEILTRSNEVGVDIFARQMPSRFVFFQGHPEYDALSLQREYMRDIARFLAGQRDHYPNIPTSYFDAETEDILRRFEARAKLKRDPTLAAELPGLTLRPELASGAAVTLLFRNWIGFLAGGGEAQG